mgnify:CR=1 FL=1
MSDHGGTDRSKNRSFAQMYLQLSLRPFAVIARDRWFIETNIKVQMYIFFKSAHKSVPDIIPIIIITPPIVGVPLFFII